MRIIRFDMNKSIVEAVTSDEAERVTPHICAIYLRLISAPSQWWQENEVLSIKAEIKDNVLTPAWSVLVEQLQVPPETARRALDWFEEKGFIRVRSPADAREIRISFEGRYIPEDRP